MPGVVGSALAAAFVDVLPTPGSFAKGITDDITGSAPAAQAATEKVAEKIGGVFTNLGQRVGGEMGELLTTVGEGIEHVIAHSKELGAVIGAGGAIALGVGLTLQHIGSADKQASDQLKASIAATGASYSDYKDQVEEAVKSGEKYAHGAPDTMQALQAITQATQDPTKAFKDLALVEDLAAAKHESLAAAAQQIALVYAGSTRLLKQYGITTKDVDDALTELAAKLHGQAAASVDNFDGKVAVARTRVEDFVATMGQKVGPAFTLVGTAATIASGGIETWVVLSERAEAKGVSLVSSLSGVGKAALGIGAVLGVAAVGWEVYNQRQQVAAEHAKDVAEAIKADNGVLGENTEKLIANRLAGDGAFNQALKLGIGQKTLTDAILHGGAALDQVRGIIGYYNQDTGRAAQNQEHSTTVTKDFADAARSLGSTLNGVTGDVKAGEEQAKNYAKATGAAGSATNDLWGYMYAGIPATNAAKSGLDKVDVALKPVATDADRVSAAWDKMTGKLGVEQSENAAKEAILAVHEALKKKKASLDSTTAAGLTNRDQVLDAIGTFQDEAKKLQDVGHSNKFVQDRYLGHLEALRKTTKAGSPLRAEIDLIIAKFKKIPRGITTTIEIEAYLKSLPTHSSMAPGEAGFGATRANKPKPKKSSTSRAQGGPVVGGTSYNFNEAGVGEQWVAPGDGYVVPRSSAAPRTIHITQQIGAVESSDIAAAHRRAAEAAWSEITRLEQAV